MNGFGVSFFAMQLVYHGASAMSGRGVDNRKRDVADHDTLMEVEQLAANQ
jgi:hypothetical protein